MAKTADEIIAALGGPKGIAAATPHKEGAVWVWKSRKKIPRRAWPDLISAFPGVVSLDELRAAEPQKSAA